MVPWNILNLLGCYMYVLRFVNSVTCQDCPEPGNSLFTLSETVVWIAFALPYPDFTLWEYTGYVVFVVNFVKIRGHRKDGFRSGWS